MEIIITKLHRASHGELDARVSINGTTVPVTRRYGSWGTVPDQDTGKWRGLLPPIARVLAEKAGKFERKEARELPPIPPTQHARADEPEEQTEEEDHVGLSAPHA